MMMTVSIVEAIAAFLMYILGGALVLFIYESFTRTKQKNLMYMALGFFLIIFGSNLNTLLAMVPTMIDGSLPIDGTMSRTAALLIQLGGILTLLYSALNPYAS
jgi:H+/Cl- antiporter ClcA